jgi:hypothetical protein
MAEIKRTLETGQNALFTPVFVKIGHREPASLMTSTRRPLSSIGTAGSARHVAAPLVRLSLSSLKEQPVRA